MGIENKEQRKKIKIRVKMMKKKYIVNRMKNGEF
jgi:hypothetical protein